MGVFTSTKQFRLGLNLINPWWLSGASIDLDLDSGRYYDSSLTALKRSLAAVTDYLSCTRASTGYAKTSAGVLTQFTNNVLRLTDLGLLVEDARTNLHEYSEVMNSWLNFQWNGIVTPTDNATTAPNGATTAALVAESSGGTTHNFVDTILSQPNATAFTYSHFIKPNGRTKIVIDMSDSTTGDANKLIDLTTNTVSAGPLGAGSWTNVSAAIEDYANGWKRVSLTGTANPGSSFSLITRIYLCDASGNNSYSGDGSSGVYAWGAQLESGSFASSYIPTTTSSATRAADNIAITGAAQTLIANATASIVAQVNNEGAASVAANLVDSNGTNLIGFDSSNHGLASITATLATANAANRTSRDKIGLAWSGAGRSLVLNGGTVATDASAQTPSATQHLGSSGSTNFLNGIFERLTVFNSKLADATLQGFTAP
jgi:hypothetical protein